MKTFRELALRYSDLVMILFGFIGFFLIYIFILPPLINEIREGIGPLVFSSIVLIFFGVGVPTFLFHQLWDYYCVRNKRKKNWMVVYTIALMILFLSVGSYLIVHSYGESKLDLVLRNSDNLNEIKGSLHCTDNSGKFLEDSQVYCRLSPRLDELLVNKMRRVNMLRQIVSTEGIFQT